MEMFLSDSDCESFSEISSSEDLDDIDSMYGGQARSILSNLERSIGKIDDFLAFERGFLHGDIVCLVSEPSGQLGKVVDVDMTVDLETVYGKMIKEVNCKKLRKIRSLVVGDYVVHGPWLGRVNRVVDRVTILFDDGAKCEVTAVDPENLLIPLSPSIIEDSQYPYYPGQRVQIRLSNVFKSARWLCGSWKENRDKGTVCHVEAGLVYVDWVASAMVGGELSLSTPPRTQDSRSLTLLSCFSHAHWQLGDWCIIQVDDDGVVEQEVINYANGKQEGHKKLGRLPERNPSSTFEEIYVIVKTKTKVDVLWQDGTHSIGLDSQFILPVNSVDDHEFWPEQFVLEKTISDDQHVSNGQRLGIVKCMDAKERTVKLKWETRVPNQTDDSDGKYNEETVSAYELIEYPDYSYCLGDIVFRFQKDLSVVEAEIGSGSLQQTGEDVYSSKQISEGCGEYPNKSYLSCIGNVIGFKDGGILVRWASGFTSKVGPCEIIGIDKYDDSASTPVFQNDIEDSSSQEMLKYDEQSWHQKEKGVLEIKAVSDAGEADDKKEIWESSSLLLPRAAVGFFTNIAASLFGFLGSTSLSGSIETSCFGGPSENYNHYFNGSASEDEDKVGSVHGKEVIGCGNLVREEPLSVGNDFETIRKTSFKPEVEEAYDNKELSFSSSCEGPGHFKQFDMIGDSSDHHFVYGSGKGHTLSQVNRGWLKKVQQEWSILQKNLPETICVRVYEERIDLLRAAIVGAPGTPYHDGLFFFDFYLPPDYPHEPPMVYYNSGGLRVNPNLYESGKVCLSLLKTWTGTGTEVWNPGSSTILQVLLSLQALVLNEKPYFNEAGYDTQMGRAEGEKNSMTYNENAFLLSCKSMLYLLHKPPKHFEAFVDEHFRRRSHSILLACKEYMDGAPVGCAFGHGKVDQETQKCSSMGFKIMLAKLFPKLVSGFADKGIDCSQFLEPEK
ncbi:Ubiquitin-conjugating enzyme [Macleaya cordata]|uniref:E2 ubiquitin-conjugating enzyme n=1 Tax=Macleaya cordata TaxID=56857 RepID=A0A200QBL2_MACCD|nr:Ubiquitin-conjugating enzyme [Macleaya cordata]